MKEDLKGELVSKDLIDKIFNHFESNLLDGKKIIMDLKDVTFINVYFLEQLEKLVEKAKKLNIELKIVNVKPSIYKVFHIAKDKDILSVVV